MSRTTPFRYAVVDLETTGGRPDRDKITEIAIVIHNGEDIIETFSSLINPGVSIPPMITRITGITQEMVDDAPPFYEVARQVALMTEQTVFVAHNVRFDYQFLREAFSDLGFTFSRPHLCTVKMTRKAFPGLPSYSLGNLIRHFGISVNSRHRALDDALATSRLLELILEKENRIQPQGITAMTREQKPPAHLPQDLYDQVPEACGIYYFYNQAHEVIYVGKSKHIRRRLKEHLGSINQKAARLDREIACIDWVITGSELYASLLESYEIRRLMPAINKAQRNRNFPAAIYLEPTTGGYNRFRVSTRKDADDPVNVYASSRAARAVLESRVDQFSLCWHLTLEHTPGKPCFKHHLGICLGACVHQEPPEDYNARTILAAASLGHELEGHFILVDSGPSNEQFACIHVENGIFQAMGIVDNDIPQTYSGIVEQLTPYPDHPEIRRLIRQYMVKKHIKRILRPEDHTEVIN
ncbi:MAG: GIY-YIG nuclease family protein [Saprospiraceae bacterium]|nr:GIY-YIG nuclease family protein [Saprospiraceae bacterium]